MADEWYDKIFWNKHDCINEFLERKQATGTSPRTLNAYSRILKKFYHEHYPDTHPSDTTVGDIENYILDLDARDCSQNTKRRYVESLSAFFTWTLQRPRFEDFTGNPARVVLEEIPKEKKSRPDCATWDHGKQIIHHIGDPRNKLCAIIMAKTGARVTEVLTLEQDDLLLDDGFIRFRDRKGGNDTVNPVDDETIDAIQRYLWTRPDDDDILFTGIRGDRVSRKQANRAVKQAAVDAGVMEEGETAFRKKFTAHTYRTVFTTVMRNAGMPDWMVRYLRGDGEKEIMDRYTRVDREKMRWQYLECIKPLNV
jgi:integrase/recombinase XerD